MADVKYKNYRIGEHLFTVKFKKYRSRKKPIYFEITSVTSHVKTCWEEIKYFFNKEVYSCGWWDCQKSIYPTIEERIILELEDVVKERERELNFSHWWWH